MQLAPDYPVSIRLREQIHQIQPKVHSAGTRKEDVHIS